ncbi:MAG: galactose mutarotase, partial [Planctomycetes bacterium]|nr:galactose mutarotase [Planctomycetota bacterium]
FDKQVWQGQAIEDDAGVGVKLTLTSPDGDEGYPGNLSVTVIYRLTNDNELSLAYNAQTDKATPLSLTNHTYFNLNGFQGKILDHKAKIAADKFLLPDETNVPVGDEQDVAASVWNYNVAKPIGDAFTREPKGFEHYYVFSKSPGSFENVAEFADETSGRTLQVSTSEPGMLFYTGFYTSDDLKRQSGPQFGQFKAFCCETSRYPNGPNIDNAPQSVLQPNETYQSKTVFKFSW